MEELDLKEVFKMFWSKRNLIIMIISIFIVIGIVYTLMFVTPKYQASTTLVLTQSNTNSSTSQEIITNQEVTLNSNLIATYTDILTSDRVLNQVIENLNEEGVEDLNKESIKKNVEVAIKNEDSNVLIMTITNEDSEKAMLLANEIASVGIVEVNEYFNSINNIKVLDEAVENTTPSNINHVRDILIFTVIGFIVAFGYVLVAYMLDNTVKSAEEIEKACGTLVLATIPLNEKKTKKGGKK